MTDEQIKNYTLRITQANSGNLVVIIYELLFDCLKEASAAYGINDIEEYKHQVKKAERYMGELIHGINYADEIGKQIGNDYIRIHKQLISARVNRNMDMIDAANKNLQVYYPLFQRIAKEDSDASLMENTQKVYAGLTYGKTSLNEMAIDPKANRGFCV